MAFSLFRIRLLFVLIAMLTACAPRTVLQDRANLAQAPVDFPNAYYRQAAMDGRKVLQVDSTRSLVVIEVHRGGVLARLGHDHVVASHSVNGYVVPDDGRADLYVPLDNLVVDEAPLRTEAGLDSRPSTEAIEGTRRNMLEKVLETGKYPFAVIRIVRPWMDRSTLNVSITLHGATRTYDVPATIENQQDGISVSGRMAINQTDFGIAPFSVMGGMLGVQDRLDLRFRILAGTGSAAPLLRIQQ